MTDIELRNGGAATDSAGRRTVLRGLDAKLQSAVIRVTARRGGFVYDRSLGSDCESGMTEAAAELAANEALAKLSGAYVKVIESGETMRTEMIIDGHRKLREVCFYG